MRKLIMKMSLTIDGFVAGPNGEADWIFKSSDDQSLAWSLEKSMDSGIIIMGRKSFEAMAPYWPTATGPFAAPMNALPKAVFTRKGYVTSQTKGLDSPAAESWLNARVFDGDLADGISKLKSEPGKPIVAIGGAGFMNSLITTGLIDEYHLVTHPVVLGKGLPIFNGTPIQDLKLVEVNSFPKGIVARTYAV